MVQSRPFYIHIGTLFMLLVVGTQFATGLYVRDRTHALISAEADNLFEHIAEEARLEVRVLRQPISVAVTVSSFLRTLEQATTLAQRMERVNVFASTLSTQPQTAAIYIGYATGDFFLLRPIRTDAQRARFKVPEQTAYLVQSLEEGGIKARWLALNSDLRVIDTQTPADYRFDPRTRPWYTEARRTPGLQRTPPYVFATTGELGRTVAQETEGGKAVVGADLLISTLSDTLRENRITPHTELAIFDSAEGVIAYSDPERVAERNADGQYVRRSFAQLSPVMASLQPELGRANTIRRVNIQGADWLVRVTPLKAAGSMDQIVMAVPVEELMANATAIENQLKLNTALIVVLMLPVIWWIARSIAAQLNQLMEQAAAIRRFDFRTQGQLTTRIREVFGLGDAMQQMKDTIQKFLEVSTALASERNFDRLIQRVLQEVCEAAASDGGVIYLYDAHSRTLQFVEQRWNAGRPAPTALHPQLAMDDSNHVVVAAVLQSSEPARATIAAQRPQGLDYLNERYGSDTLEMLIIPLLGRSGGVVGVLCNFIAPGAEVPSVERMSLVKAFAGAAAVSIDQQSLLKSQKLLLSSFIGLVAGAIDAKSPYTGGHCQRVPELTEMLTRAAHESDAPAFASFRLGDDQWEALHIAAWLHDCGKVTTPEYVVDKATKLETIYDRIHEVRMRFEVLKRDAEIAMLQAILAGGDAEALRTQLQADHALLDEEFHFIAACNEGGEFMSAEHLARLKSIGQRRWQRTLDDRKGISWEERKRMERSEAASLPTLERLLDDKPAHIIERGPSDLMPVDNRWGFQVKVPENLYNRGELYNLSVARGTLTEEERYKINDHIVQTIVMLSKLPFPQHLSDVIELAGGHHEKMDGTGYPRGLQGSAMSTPARIMAIADVFEALTATDRPYKKGKTLSEAIRIMGFMARDKHIDADLFKLFLSSGVYRRYAEKYMPASLIDTVDTAPYLA